MTAISLADLTPEVISRTGGGEFGTPRTFKISDDGSTVAYLRSPDPDTGRNDLWILSYDTNVGWNGPVLLFSVSSRQDHVAASSTDLRERAREVGGGITRFTMASDGSWIAFELAGVICAIDVATRIAAPVPGSEGCAAPILSRSGRYLAMLTAEQSVRVFARETDRFDRLIFEASPPEGPWSFFFTD